MRNLAYRYFKKLGLLSILFVLATSVQAGMVGNEEILHQDERAQLAGMLERDDVQQQLTDLGVDPVAARARVDQMTVEEVARLNGRIAEVPAGAGGIGAVELLLIIIIIILIV